MKIIHISSGLGNQMLTYCELLAMKMANPEDEFYIEKTLFDIPDIDAVISQWNGYELERIFHIRERDISDLLGKSKYQELLEYIKQSKFWNDGFDYATPIVGFLNAEGLDIFNTKTDLNEAGKFASKVDTSGPQKKYKIIGQNKLFGKLLYFLKKIRKFILYKKKNTRVEKDFLYWKTTKNLYAGQRLSFIKRGVGIEDIDKHIRNVFVFSPFEDKRNREFADFIQKVNSVAIHVRRGDMLQYNGDCYRNGYFKRAVNKIRKHVKNPVFIFFTDPDSVGWIKENGNVFSLDYVKDRVYFVDWNKGLESYRDMQLMALCRHNIITTSSFGWWGAYLNKNPNKITISPEINMNTTHHV